MIKYAQKTCKIWFNRNKSYSSILMREKYFYNTKNT